MTPPSSPQFRGSTAKTIAALSLLLLGFGFGGFLFGKTWVAFLTLGPWGGTCLAVFCIAIVSLAAMPPTAYWLSRLLDLVRCPGELARKWSSMIAGLMSFAYLLWTAVAQHRPRWPYVHDEFSYLIQAHQFAAGHLWMPAHPLAQFFDSFQLFTAPVYASAYFPGTALLYVPGIWLHLPAWITSLAIAGVIAGLLYRITTELIDGVAGWLAVLLLWSDDIFRKLSMLTLAQNPLLLYGLLAVLAWLKWRANPQRRWAVAIGAFLGLAAVTRPVDALCFAVPIGIAMWVDLARFKPRFFPSVLCAVAGAIPLLILQLILNFGITGHITQTPFRMYADRDYPGTSYGFHPYDPAAKPISDLPQKQALYQEYQPLINQHTVGHIVKDQFYARGPMAPPRLTVTLTQSSPAPFPLLLLLMPLALSGLTRARAVMLASMPLFVALYVPYVFFFPHYVMTAGPAVIFTILLGGKQLETIHWPSATFFTVAMPLLIAGLTIAALPQWTIGTSDDLFDAPLIVIENQKLAALPHLPAIVLFKYDPKRNTNEEPVYNPGVAWPDDATVIRAHDRGPLNAELFRYYATHQPGRFVYRFDEKTASVILMGNVSDLAKAGDRCALKQIALSSSAAS